MEAQIFPREIIQHAVSRELEIVWEDGSNTRYSFGELRKHCRCADCASGKTPIMASGIDLLGIRQVGTYGMQMHFSDGHLRGIYPWSYLRESKHDPGDWEIRQDDSAKNYDPR